VRAAIVVFDGADELEEFDLIVVPGGGWNDRSAPGAWAEFQRGDLPPATVVDARVVDDGDVVTSGGVTSGLDLYERIAREIEHEQVGEVARTA
jgi:hypothetical protein